MTQDEVFELMTQVQNRAALYTSNGVDPLKMEDLLDRVYRALREMHTLQWQLQYLAEEKK